MLADSLGSLGVITSTICVKYYGLLFADALSSFILACFILASALPFLKQTISHLVLEVPPGLKKKLRKIEQDLDHVSGIKVSKVEGWKMASKQRVVTINAKTNRPQSEVLPKIEEIMAQHDIKHAAIQVESTARRHRRSS